MHIYCTGFFRKNSPYCQKSGILEIEKEKKERLEKRMLKDAVLTVGDIFNNYNFDVNCNYDVYDCTKQGSD